MKAMVIKEFGGPEVFTLAEVEKPSVADGHILVKVAATSVNTVDTMIRELGSGLPFAPPLPGVLGMDFAGTVVEVGSGVDDFAVGDEVYGCAGGLGDLQGTLAEYMSANAHLCAHKPKSLSMKEAAALPLCAITAYEGLERSHTAAGQKVLVHGGGGGVGHLAIQIAKSMGAEVFATVGRDEHVALVESLGATAINYKTDAVADYVAKHTGGVGFDVVFDSVGGANMAASFEAAKLNGHIASTVSMIEMDLTPVHMKGLSLHVVFMLIQMIHGIREKEHQHILQKVAQIADAGQLKPVLDQPKFMLQDIGQAHARLSSGQATGKVVIEIGD